MSKRWPRAQNDALDDDDHLEDDSLLPRYHEQNRSPHRVGISRHVIGPSTLKKSSLILMAFFLSSTFHRNLRRSLSNHKLLGSNKLTIVSALLTFGAMTVVVCGVWTMRWIGRVPSGRKRRIAIVLFSPITAFVAYSSGGWRKCGSLRTLGDPSGERGARLCADGMSFGGHVPSRLLIWESAIRFFGDTFLYRDEQTIPHLDWRTSVLDTDQCRGVLKDALETKPILNPQCDNSTSSTIGPPPIDGGERSWPTERKHPLSMPPFRVSNELRSPDTLQQAKMVTRQLDECRFDSASHIVLEPFPPSSSFPSLELVEAEHGTNGVAIVLVASKFEDHNVYHITQMDSGLRCLFLALQNAALIEQKTSVILPCSWGSPIGVAIVRALAHVHGADVLILDQNYSFIQQQSYRSLVHVHGPSGLIRSGPVGLLGTLWDSFKFELYRLPSSFGVTYADAVRRGNRMELRKRQQGVEAIRPNVTAGGAGADHHVLVVQRRGNRRLVGSQTGSFSEIVDAMCNLGLPVRAVEFEALSAEEQIDAAASATVMVGAHGAGMSHASWMRPGGAVVEVLLRQGFNGSDYHKADFANLARFYGLDYTYYDAVVLEPKITNNIGFRKVVVDVEELAGVVLCLYQKARGR